MPLSTHSAGELQALGGPTEVPSISVNNVPVGYGYYTIAVR